jgi:hypothetical protein
VLIPVFIFSFALKSSFHRSEKIKPAAFSGQACRGEKTASPEAGTGGLPLYRLKEKNDTLSLRSAGYFFIDLRFRPQAVGTSAQ